MSLSFVQNAGLLYKWLEIEDRKAALWCQAQWEVYQMALRQFYGIECHLTRTDEYFGVVTEDESDWLFKVERQEVKIYGRAV